MQKSFTVLGILVLIFLAIMSGNAQMIDGGMMGGQGGHGMGPGMMTNDITIPEKLKKPLDKTWINQLDEILALERLSQAQYENDSAAYNARMPYMMVEPQEEYHIRLITRLFSAYGITPRKTAPPIKRTETLDEAYRVAANLEADLIPRYERLIEHAEDPKAREVLDLILNQTRMHYRMFSHAMNMGGMMDRGGMMGR